MKTLVLIALAFAALAAAPAPALALAAHSTVAAGTANIPVSELEAVSVRYRCARAQPVGQNDAGIAKAYINAQEAQGVGNRAVFNSSRDAIAAFIAANSLPC